MEGQIDETEALVATHARSADEISDLIDDKEQERARVTAALEELTKTYVSERQQAIAEDAAERAGARARVDQLRSYVELLDKADAARVTAEKLENERIEVEAQLEAAERLDQETETRLAHFEERFGEAVEALRLPYFTEDADPRAAIHRADFEPIVNGRRVERHSGGMAVLINVAYMIALHRTAIELDLTIPNLLLIDGINQNLGRGEYDNERYELIWHELLRLAAEHGERLQLIVATNDVPSFVEEAEVVRIRLTADNRLVPLKGDAGEERATSQRSG